MKPMPLWLCVPKACYAQSTSLRVPTFPKPTEHCTGTSVSHGREPRSSERNGPGSSRVMRTSRSLSRFPRTRGQRRDRHETITCRFRRCLNEFRQESELLPAISSADRVCSSQIHRTSEIMCTCNTVKEECSPRGEKPEPSCAITSTLAKACLRRKP